MARRFASCWLSVAALSWACGLELQIADSADPDASTSDAAATSSGGAAPADAAAPALEADTDAANAQCDPTWPVSAPEAVPGFADELVIGPRLSHDERTVYFCRDVGGRYRIFAATRAAIDAPFGAPVELTALAAGATSDIWPSVTDDGLTLSYSRLASPNATLEAHRDAVADDFGNAAPFGIAGDLHLVRVPESPRFFWTRPAGSTLAVYESDGVEAVRVFPGSTTDDYPYWYEARSQTLWLRRGGVGMSAVRLAGGWSEPAPLAAPAATVHVTWTSPDGCRLYGHEPNGAYHLFVQRRLPRT